MTHNILNFKNAATELGYKVIESCDSESCKVEIRENEDVVIFFSTALSGHKSHQSAINRIYMAMCGDQSHVRPFDENVDSSLRVVNDINEIIYNKNHGNT